MSWRDALAGLVLGTLTGSALAGLGLQSLPWLRGEHVLGASAIIGVVLGLSRIRKLLWATAGAATLSTLVIGYTPLIVGPVRECVRRDPLRPVEAVVVLSSNIQADGDLTDAAQVRLLRGYEVLREGLAKRLVITRLAGEKRSYMPAIRRQMKAFGMDYPIDETAAVANTHDEALEVSRLARKERWRTVILVSEPTHLRRAAAAFEKAGVKVLCSPCAETKFDLETMETPGERLEAFRRWLWETAGLAWYRFKKWA